MADTAVSNDVSNLRLLEAEAPRVSEPVRSLFDLPHSEARALLRSGMPVYLPVNPVEFHGPHLPLHTDALISRGLAETLHARLAERDPALRGTTPIYASDLEVGVDASQGPGTRNTP